MKIKCSVCNGEGDKQLVEGEVGIIVNDETGELTLLSPENWGTYQKIYTKENGMKGIFSMPISPEGIEEMKKLEEEIKSQETVKLSNEEAEAIKKDGEVALEVAK